MRIGSLFSGIGGLELGLERAGLGPVAWQVEKEEFPRAVLAKHWPNATRYEDVREVGSHNLEPVDLICGGSPCQDISLAGSGAGLEGNRSGLWWEMHRIIRELRPRYVVWENVSAALSRGGAEVFGSLSALGYDLVWDCIPAAAIGAPHRRDRVFLVAWRVSDAERDGVREESRRGSWLGDGARSPFARHLGAVMADADGGRPQGERSDGLLDGERASFGNDANGRDLPLWPPPPGDMHAWGRVSACAQPALCRLADGLPAGLVRNRRHTLKGYGNAVAPQVAEVIGRFIVERR